MQANKIMMKLRGLLRWCNGHRWWTTLILILLSLGYCAYPRKAPPPLLDYESVSRGSVERWVTAAGRLQPREMVMIGSEVSGLVEDVYVKVGDKVRAGQVLARIDDSVLEENLLTARANVLRAKAALRRAEVSLKAEQDNSERSKNLYERGFVTNRDYSAQQARLAEYEAQLASAKADLVSAQAEAVRTETSYSRAQIKAPIDGVVTFRDINKGQTLAASFQSPSLFQVASDLSLMKLEISVDEVDMGQVEMGQWVSFTVDAYPDRTFDGRITQINSLANNNGGIVTYTITAEVKNPQGRLRPGMSANASILIKSLENVLRVSRQAAQFKYEAPKATSLGGFGIRISVKGSKSGQGEAAREKAARAQENAEADQHKSINLWRLVKDADVPEQIRVAQIFEGDEFVAIEGNVQVGDRIANAIKAAKVKN